MTKTILNKRKIKKKLIFQIFFSLFLLFLFFFISNKYIYDIIGSFSKNYDYLFKTVEIEGLNNLSSNEIEKYFIEYYDKSIFLLPLKNISYEIKKNKWVKLVSLKSNHNNKITVTIEEVKPIGVYFNGTNYLLIDNFGEVIDFIDKKNIFQYIVFFGENARVNVVDLIIKIPLSLKSIIKEAEFINKRRWNIILKNNIKIKLPEKAINDALLQFIEIYDNISDQDKSIINSIDLRISKKAIIKFIE